MIHFCKTEEEIYPSCKKAGVQDSPLSPSYSATIVGFKDSTLLIKSILENSYDSATNMITDTTTTYYYYDTVNCKISLSMKGYSDPTQASLDSFEYSYNSAGLLIHFANKSSQANSTTLYVITEDISCDASYVVKAVTDNFSDCSKLTYNINKTTLANGGYSLSWYDLINVPDTDYYTVNFEKMDRLSSFYFYGHSDSLEYDDGGNIQTIMQTDYLNPYSLIGADTYPLYDFISRDTKGDQLYNLERILNNGMSGFPAETSFGVTSEFDYQYTKYPALSTNIKRPASDSYYPGGGEYLINYTTKAEYDNQNRLIEYKMFFNDTPFAYLEYVISYYK